MEIPSQPAFLAPLRAFITTIAERCGFDEVAQFQLALAIDEAVANVINHGYGRRPDGRVSVKLWRITNGREGIQVVIEDEGRQIDPALIRSRDLDDVRPGGLGVHIIREVMDHCRWERRAEGGMRLVLVKFLPPAEADAARSAACPSNTPTGIPSPCQGRARPDNHGVSP